jgi:hypothetical protein
MGVFAVGKYGHVCSLWLWSLTSQVFSSSFFPLSFERFHERGVTVVSAL